MYYEPLARVAKTLEEIINGPPVKKLLFMTEPGVVDTQLKPDWGVSYQLHLVPACMFPIIAVSLASDDN